MTSINFISLWSDSTMGLKPRSPARETSALPILSWVITMSETERLGLFWYTLRMQLSWILGHGAGSLLSQWSNAIKPPWVRTAASQFSLLIWPKMLLGRKQQENGMYLEFLHYSLFVLSTLLITFFFKGRFLPNPRAITVGGASIFFRALCVLLFSFCLYTREVGSTGHRDSYLWEQSKEFVVETAEEELYTLHHQRLCIHS